MFVLLILQHNQPSNESRLKTLLSTEVDFDISQLPQMRVNNMLPSNLPASDRQGEEVLAIHLLMADLNPSPFSNLWQLVAFHSCVDLHLVVLVENGVFQFNHWKLEF